MPIELSRFVGVRFKPDDYRQLEAKANRLGTTVSGLIRDAALDIELAPPRHRLADQDLINQLVRIGNNLNQQTRALHQLRHREISPDFVALRGVLEEVHQLLEQVSTQVAEANR